MDLSSVFVQKLAKKQHFSLIERFEKEYNKYATKICKMIQIGLQKHNITDFNVQFFLLPFPSVKEFRKAFYDKIGMSYDFE